MIIRTADMSDLERITGVEAGCFPEAEAAKAEDFKKRLEIYPNHFLLMFDGDRLISFVDGFVTDEPDLTDEMYENSNMHNENGAWQMIFGVNTVPEYRGKGYAGTLIKKFISDAEQQGRKGVVLTCKEKLISYYEKFGFKNEGVSASVHGNVIWYQMRIEFSH